MPYPTDDAWTWRIHYADGATLDEFTPVPDAPGEWLGHGMAEVDFARAVAVELVPSPARTDLAGHFALADVQAGERLIFYRTRLPIADLDAEREIGRLCGTVIGWQRTVGRGRAAHNVASFTCFLDSGSSFTCGDRDAVRARLFLIAQASITRMHADA